MRNFFLIFLLALGAIPATFGHATSTGGSDTMPATSTMYKIEIKPYLFISWDSDLFPEAFQPLPQASAGFFGQAAAPAAQLRADVRLRKGEAGSLLVQQENALYLAAPDKAPLRIPVQGEGRVVDALVLEGRIFVLLQQGTRFLVQHFEAGGSYAGLIALPQNALTEAYQQLLKSRSSVYAVGNAAHATFLKNPTVYQLEAAGGIRKLHHWEELSCARMFMDGNGTLYYTKEIDRLRFWTTFSLEQRQESVSEAFGQAGFAYLGLPIGMDPAGLCIGRKGFGVALIDRENEIKWEVELRNILHDGQQTCYARQVQGGISLHCGAEGDFAEKVTLETGMLDQQYPGRNWKLIGLDAGGNYILSGTGMRVSGEVLVAMDSEGQLAGAFEGNKSEVEERMMPPEHWVVDAEGALLAPVSGPDGLRVYRIALKK